MIEQPFDRLPVEQVGVVLQRAGERLVVVGNRQAEIELRGAGALLLIEDPERQFLSGRVGHAVVLEHEHDIEERRPARIAKRAQDLDEPVEGHLLMLEGAIAPARTRPRSDRKVGSPSRLVRSTIMFTK